MGKIEIGIPDGIDSGASDGKNGIFENQKSITKVKFGKNCTFVGDDAFENCKSLSEINEDNVIEAIGTNAFAGTAITSANFDALTELESGAFKGCKELESIIMPNVTSIPDNAFNGCVNLKDIDLNNCTSIGNNAFEGCENIKQITLSKCETIGDFAFINCKKLNKVYIKINSDKVCVLGDSVFYTYDNGKGSVNENILFFIHPDKFNDYKENWVTYAEYMIPFVENYQIIYKTDDGIIIGSNSDSDYVFDSDGASDSDGIIKYKNIYTKYGLIEFDADLKSLNDKIFSQKGTLTSIYLPNTCERIGEKEFYKCVNLIDIILPDNLKYIDDSAFAYCEKIESFEIPETIETLGEGIFMGCGKLEEIKGKFVTDDKKSIVCNNTLIYVLPKDDRTKLNISDIDKTITNLGKGCFYGCKNLIRVDIPSNITEIGDNAFEGCENLREIHFHGDIPTLGNDIFANINNNDLKIFVPETKFENYYKKIPYDYLKYLRPMPEDKTMIYFIDGDKKVDPYRDTKCIHDTREDGKTITYYKTPNLNSTVIVEQYYADTDVKEVILAKSYTEIKSGAFKNCVYLTYVYLNNVKILGNNCFKGCSNLTSIIIPDLTTKIGDSTFENCTNLKRVDISDLSAWCKISFGNSFANPLYYGTKLYLNGSELTDITIPSGVTEIKNYAFYNCDSLTSITIPDSVTSIGYAAFAYCSSLTSVIIGNSVTSIGKFAFYTCTKMTSIIIPDSVTEIGSSAFYYCTSLKSVIIPNGVTEIVDDTFSNCKSLTSVTIPDSVTSIRDDVFAYCTNLKSVTIPNSVTEIGSCAFYECSSLTSVTIPDGVTSIGGSAFYNCTNLKSVTIPNSVTSIGSYAFMGCTGKLTIKNKYIVESNANLLGYAPFLMKSNFAEIIIGNNITKIGKNIFCGLGSIESITIPNSVKEIGDSAFEGCTSLKKFTIPNSVTSIGNSVFLDCNSLICVTIPDGVTSIGNYAFCGCNGLQHVNSTLQSCMILPNSIKTIGDYAFAGCNRLWDISLSTSLLELGSRCFDPIVPLKAREINIPNGSTTIPKFVTYTDDDIYYPFGKADRALQTIYIPIGKLTSYKTNANWKVYTTCMKERQ